MPSKKTAPEEPEEPEEEEPIAPKGKLEYSALEDIPGIGPATLAKLKEIGYATIESLATASVHELMKAGMSDKVATRIISQAR